MDECAALIAGMPAATLDLPRLETLVTMAEDRCQRAAERLARAQAENDEAAAALEHARAARSEWIADDPMLML